MLKWILILLAVLGGLGVYFCTYQVNEKEWAIVTEFGKPVKIVKEAGLYVKAPGFIHTVNRFDRRLNVFDIPPIQLLLADKKPIIIGTYVAWRISDPLVYFQAVGNANNAQQKLSDMVGSQLSIAMGDYSIQNIINTKQEEVKLAAIEAIVLKNSAENAMAKYGIEVSKVGFQRISYPAVVAQTVYQRMKSERNKEAAKLRAEGKEEATKIEAEADNAAALIMSEAEKEALMIRGEGEKSAMQLYGKTYSLDPEFFRFVKSLEMYQQVIDHNTTLVLSTDSELMRYMNLNQAPGR